VIGEAGVTKETLTGVIKTLQNRKLIRRIPHKDDLRRVLMELRILAGLAIRPLEFLTLTEC
jgi:DNA-binding MarR family transcriptional regulator